jgi:putative endonuclease
MAANNDPWFCYMLLCGDGSLYVGATKDRVGRTKRHNWGVGSRHTALRRPVNLVWQERHEDERSARKREAELKGWRREKKLGLIARYKEIHPSPAVRAQDEISGRRPEISGE